MRRRVMPKPNILLETAHRMAALESRLSQL
jgi:hypothetical protein